MKTHVPGHVDIPRLREGRLGGAFWTVWTQCPATPTEDPGPDFLIPQDGVRDSLEMVDLIINMISQLDDLQYARSSSQIREAFNDGKIASLIGMEGTHFLGNSLSVLRIFAQLGVRYVTLTHTCHSAFASSNGAGGHIEAAHEGNGLTPLGLELVRELNRLGIMVDLSHVSDETAKQALAVTKAPAVWTHSGARALWDHPRNIPDDILRLVGDGPGKNPGVINSIFYPEFIGPPHAANVSRVADHIEYIADIVGKKHVGIASDFDGMHTTVEGLEDATKYPNLVMELIERGWSDAELTDLMGGNLMRVMDEVDEVAKSLKHTLPSAAIWEKRVDLPARWGGQDDAYYPPEVRDAQRKLFPVHDEL